MVIEHKKVNRVELVTQDGREFVNWECKNVKTSLQDDGRTLKIFLEKKDD